MTKNILYIPLDERPCNYKYPQLLADMVDDINLLVPPIEYMGKKKQPADMEKLWAWVFENAADCDYAILSIDTLVYGNIINSRIHHLTFEQAENYLNNIKKIKDINPMIEIHAFNLVARVANSNNDSEDPDYWKTYGTRIWRYAYLMDKIHRKCESISEEQDLELLEEEIPNEYMDDFLSRRKINRYVNLMCIDMVKSSIIDYLVIPKDDTAEYGFAALDQMKIAKKITEYNIMHRIMVYPGADEVGCVLFARIFNGVKRYIPKIHIHYSSVLGPSIVPKYEDRPLHEGIKAQIASLGGICVNDAQNSDLLLAVHSPGKYMIESFDQYAKDITFFSYNNLHEFLSYIKYYIETFQKPCAIADVAFANGADNDLMLYANELGILENICAYGGWNTAQNTIGVVLSQAVIYSYYNEFKGGRGENQKSEQLLVRKLIEDWLFQSNVLHQMIKQKDTFSYIDPYDVGDYRDEVSMYILECLQEEVKEKFNGEFCGKKIEIEKLKLPWNRIFEIDFNIRFGEGI